MCLGVPAEVVSVEEDAQKAVVAINGVERAVSTALLVDEGLHAGDWVLVHVGFALTIIDADEARITLDQIAKLGVLDDEVASFSTSNA